MHPGVATADEDTPLLSEPPSLKGHTVYIYLIAGLSAIGGFLFGYDTGIISGAMIFIKDVFELDEVWHEAIVSSTLLAAWIFSLTAGYIADRFGRKPVILISSVVFVIGSLLMGAAWNKGVLLVGRLIVGVGVGLASMVIPIYMAELSPPKIRGQLVMINFCCVTGGQFIANMIAYGFSFMKNGHEWRYMLSIAAIPAAIQFFSFLAMPESPRWLIRNNYYDKGKQVLKLVRPKGSDIDTEFEAIKKNCIKADEERQELKDPEQSTISRILMDQPVRSALIVGCALQFVQQVSGINTVMYYTASIFEMAGVYSKQEAILYSTGTSFVNFSFTCLGLLLVERVGRRKLTLLSLTGVVIGLLILGAGFQFAAYNSPAVTEVNSTSLNNPCFNYADCSSCTRDSSCGFCFKDDSEYPGASCLRVNPVEYEQSLIGNCSSHSSQAPYIWAYRWCPSSYAWLTMLGMVFYLAFFAIGLGPMPWTINSEIYPSWARSWCQSVSASVTWFFNLVVSMSFLSLTGAITKQGAFYLYSACSLCGLVYFLFVLPETRGKTLEELEQIFASKSWLKRRAERLSKK